MCLIMARTFSCRHSLDCVKVLLRKQKDKLYSTLLSGQDNNLLLVFHFWFS